MHQVASATMHQEERHQEQATPAPARVALVTDPRRRPEPEPVWVTALAPPRVEAVPPKTLVESIATPTPAVVAPSEVNGNTPNAAPPTDSIASVNGHATVRTTRRDYDYFADLDENLARLWRDERREADGCGSTDVPPNPPA